MRLNHRQAQVFIETFLYEFFGRKNIYIIDAVNTIRNEGRPDSFTNFSFVIGANFREDSEKFACHISSLLMEALNDNFDGAAVGTDWHEYSDAFDIDYNHKFFPEVRLCVNVY